MKRNLSIAPASNLLFILFSVFAFLVTSSPLSAQNSKKFEKRVELESGGKLTLETYKGSIKVKTWNKSEVEIKAIIEAPWEVSDRYAEESVAATEIDIRSSRSSLLIRSDYDAVPSRRSWYYGESKSLPFVHYTITAPKTLDLRIDDHKSEIELTDIDGEVAIDTHKGILEAKNLNGRIYLETHKGDFHLSGVAGSIDANTHKGEIRIEDAGLTDRSRLETYKGLIAIQLPNAFAFDLTAEIGEKGDLRSDFELPRRRDRRHRGEHIRAAINGGGPKIHLETDKGELRLTN